MGKETRQPAETPRESGRCLADRRETYGRRKRSRRAGFRRSCHQRTATPRSSCLARWAPAASGRGSQRGSAHRLSSRASVCGICLPLFLKNDIFQHRWAFFFFMFTITLQPSVRLFPSNTSEVSNHGAAPHFWNCEKPDV